MWRGIALVLLAGCGMPVAWDGDPAACTFVEAGACYQVRSGRAPRPEEVEEARHAAEAIWGAGMLQGYAVRLQEGTGFYTAPYAVTVVEQRLILIANRNRCSWALLAHEAGHAAGGDESHADPRWLATDAAMDALLRECGNDGDE